MPRLSARNLHATLPARNRLIPLAYFHSREGRSRKNVPPGKSWANKKPAREGPASSGRSGQCQAAPFSPCMIVRLTSISGSSDAPSRVTLREYFAIQSESETIFARKSWGS